MYYGLGEIMRMCRIIPDILALALLYRYVFYKKWKGAQLFLKSVFYLYLCGVLLVTLMPIISNLPLIFNHPYIGMNLRPYVDLLMQRGNYKVQIILNIVMMVPFGFLYPLIYKKKLPIVLISAYLMSLSIELFQPLISGA